MSIIIGDGSGKGRSVEVSAENRLRVEAVSATTEHHINHHDGNAYNVIFSQSPTAANDCIFFLQNTSDMDMVVEGVTLGFINATAVDAEFYLQIGDTGTRNSATNLTPANLNAGSGKTATGTFEKGADLDGGVATLTGGTEVERWLFANVQDLSSTHINFNQDIILPKNQTLTLWASDAGATYYCTVVFNYHNFELD